jgi:hypothetical protein
MQPWPALLLALASAALAGRAAGTPPPLRVADGGRHLETVDGRPFFWLADTAWELLHRASREEIRRYLDRRARQDFNVVLTVLIPEINGLRLPNAEGQLPLLERDPRRPNPEWFELADFLVAEAGRRGMYVGLLPTWGAYVQEEQHPLFESRLLFRPREAFDYGKFLGAYFAGRPNVVWILGGDRPPDGREETWRALATGLKEGAGDTPPKLMTYHPRGPDGSSADRLHGEAWLDFNLLQTGHRRAGRPGELVARDYAREPFKPVLNGEPGYEGLWDEMRPENPKLTDADVRRFAYESVFAGAAGHTYGANEVWMMWRPEYEPIAPNVTPPFLGARRTWLEALDYPGAEQMGELRRLMEREGFPALRPDPALARREDGSPAPALRHDDGRRALVYFAAGTERLSVSASRVNRGWLRASWFNPRRGGSTPAAWPTNSPALFRPPDPRVDWVLRLQVR